MGVDTEIDMLVVVLVVIPALVVVGVVVVVEVVAPAMGNNFTPSFALQHVLFSLPQHHDPSPH